MPLGIAQEAATPSCSKRRSQCRRRALCCWTTKRSDPFLRRRRFGAGSGVASKSRLRSYSLSPSIVVPAQSDAGSHRAQAGESRNGSLALIVGYEGLNRIKVDGGGDVDRVKGAQGGLGKRSGARKQSPVERPQRERIDQLASALEQGVEGRRGVQCAPPPYRSGNLRQDQLTAHQVRAVEIHPQSTRLVLLPDQLDQGGGVRVDDRHTQRSPRISSSARLR